MEIIRSRQNAHLRRVRAVVTGKEKGFLCLEGDRLVGEAVRLGLELEVCLVAEDRAERGAELAARGVPVRMVDAGVLQQISSLVTSPGVLAIGPAPAERALDTLASARAALVAVACGISDPGNLGALARTAEAAGAGALVLVGGANPWSSKSVRGSMGSLLRMPVIRVDDASAALAALADAGYRQVRAATRGGTPLPEMDWTPPVALWVASETGALPDAAASIAGVTIPMAGPVESLNVTVAAAVLLFAARGGQA